MHKVPNIQGEWKATEYKVRDGTNNIYNPEKIKYSVKFEQNGRFVQSLTDYANFYGVWNLFLSNRQKLITHSKTQ